MTECRFEPVIRARLESLEPLNEGHSRHADRCVACRTLLSQSESLNAALSRATSSLIAVDLHPGTLETAHAYRRASPSRRIALAAVAASAMVLVMAGAAAYAGLQPPSFDDAALRTDPAAIAAYEACLAQTGHTPRPVSRGDTPAGDDVLAYEQANSRCVVESGIGQVDGDDPAEVAYANAIATGIAQCLRDDGWELPELELEPLGRYLEPPSGVISDDSGVQAQFNRDLEACGLLYGIQASGTSDE